MDISTLLKLQEIERRKRMGERHKSIPIKKDHYGKYCIAASSVELTIQTRKRLICAKRTIKVCKKLNTKRCIDLKIAFQMDGQLKSELKLEMEITSYIVDEMKI